MSQYDCIYNVFIYYLVLWWSQNCHWNCHIIDKIQRHLSQSLWYENIISYSKTMAWSRVHTMGMPWERLTNENMVPICENILILRLWLTAWQCGSRVNMFIENKEHKMRPTNLEYSQWDAQVAHMQEIKLMALCLLQWVHIVHIRYVTCFNACMWWYLEHKHKQ